MKKCISFIAVISCILLLTACQKKDAELKTGFYLCTSTWEEVEWDVAMSWVFLDERRASFDYSTLPEQNISGPYIIDGDYLIITKDGDEGNQYKFKIKGDVLKFLPEESDEIIYDDEIFDWSKITYKWRNTENIQ